MELGQRYEKRSRYNPAGKRLRRYGSAFLRCAARIVKMVPVRGLRRRRRNLNRVGTASLELAPWEAPVPALLPALLLGSQVVLAAGSVPKLDVVPSCRSAGATSLMDPNSGTRNSATCEQDEKEAHSKLEKEWTTYSQSERDRCTRLATLGGSASYVELLTCLEIAKAAKLLPPADRLGDGSRR
jgi:hypothetical protein